MLTQIVRDQGSIPYSGTNILTHCVIITIATSTIETCHFRDVDRNVNLEV